MQCVSIFGLKFDSKSIDAIEDIKRRTNMTSILSKLMPFGVMTNIFLGGTAINTLYNITATDFNVLSKSVDSLPSIYRRVIWNIASYQAMIHFGNEKDFWEGVADGCEI